jgi:hypothetical protein
MGVATRKTIKHAREANSEKVSIPELLNLRKQKMHKKRDTMPKDNNIFLFSNSNDFFGFYFLA